MKELILKITDVNWGMEGPESWDKIEWKVYNDHTIDTKVLYVSEDKQKEKTYEITKDLYNDILKNIEFAKNIDTQIDACDGEAWEFIQYSNGNEIWKRELGYIYGIKSLENISNDLIKLINELIN